MNVLVQFIIKFDHLSMANIFLRILNHDLKQAASCSFEWDINNHPPSQIWFIIWPFRCIEWRLITDATCMRLIRVHIVRCISGWYSLQNILCRLLLLRLDTRRWFFPSSQLISLPQQLQLYSSQPPPLIINHRFTSFFSFFFAIDDTIELVS